MSDKPEIGIQKYADCQEPEYTLSCVTWANHVNLVIDPGPIVALDPAAVQALINQLQEWLAKHD